MYTDDDDVSIDTSTRPRTTSRLTIDDLSSGGLSGVLDEEAHPKPLLVGFLAQHASPSALIPGGSVGPNLLGHLVEFLARVLEAWFVRIITAVQALNNIPRFFSAIPGQDWQASVSWDNVG